MTAIDTAAHIVAPLLDALLAYREPKERKGAKHWPGCVNHSRIAMSGNLPCSPKCADAARAVQQAERWLGRHA